MSPIMIVFAPLILDRILPIELNLSTEMFICLKAGSCNRSVALPGSTNILCISNLFTHKVSTNESWCGVMTLDGLIWGKDRGSSIGWIALLMSDMDGVYPDPDCGCTQQPLLLEFKLILIVSWSAQYVVYGGSWFRQELLVGYYSFNRKGSLSSVDRFPDIPPKVASQINFSTINFKLRHRLVSCPWSL